MSSTASAVGRVREISGWGGQSVRASEIRAEDLESATRGAVIVRGLGRSYGDSSLPPPGRREAVATPLADRILSFDEGTGEMVAEAGLALSAVYRVLLPRGWFVPVTPGTWHVTLGGMVAADVHGKNHHRDGCIGEHVTRLRMRLADGRIVECGPDEEPDLFRATLGGMGLTGHILEVGIRMARVPSPWIVAEHLPIPSIHDFLRELDTSAEAWPFTVGWIDCLSRGSAMGRGVLFRGRWARPGEAPATFPMPYRRPSVPFRFPEWAMSPPAMRAFNESYYRFHTLRPGRRIEHPQTFFYPLDAVGGWNRIYGHRGVAQYQCVLPRSRGADAVVRLLEHLTERGGTSFLCVIKDCGPEGTGLLSFPMPGVSIALDLPMRDDTQQVVDALNELVIEEKGRIYLAKDALTRPEHFRAMEPRLEEFLRIRRRYDPNSAIRSAQSVRLMGDPA